MAGGRGRKNLGPKQGQLRIMINCRERRDILWIQNKNSLGQWPNAEKGILVQNKDDLEPKSIVDEGDIRV